MMSLHPLGALAVALPLCLLLHPETASAGPSAPRHSEEATRAAIELSHQARELFEAGRYEEAYARFAAADEKAHSPVFVLYMARARQHQGRLLEARELYERVVAEEIGEDAPPVMERAREDARDELVRLKLRIPSLSVAVTGEGAERAQVVLDERPVAQDEPVALDPGNHHLEVIPIDGARRQQHFELRESERRQITVALDALASSEERAETLLPGAVLTAFGGAGLVAGAVTGGLALSLTEDIKSRCLGASCLAQDEPDAERARRLATASTVSFVLGGALAAAGITLLAVSPAHVDAMSAQLQLAPDGLWLRGRF